MEHKSTEWLEETEGKIKEAWDLFDKDKKGHVIQEEIGTIMRHLGVFPNERALVLEILPEMQDDEPGGEVSYKKFEKKMLNLMATNELEPDSTEVILQAFKTIDNDNLGYISADILETLLTSKGTGFRPKELEAFFMVAKDPETGNVYYEDYISLLKSSDGKK
jgi:calmodulin